MGTLCSVMGGSDLQLLDEHLPEQWVDRVRIVGSTCLGVCHDTEGDSKPPYVLINGEPLAQASISSILIRIGEILGEQ